MIIAEHQLRLLDQVQSVREENWLRSRTLSIHEHAYCVQLVFCTISVLSLLLIEVLYLSERSAIVQLEIVLAFLYLQQYVVEIDLLLSERERFGLVEQLYNALGVDRRFLEVNLQHVLLLLRLYPLEDVSCFSQYQVQLHLEFLKL